MQERKVNMNTQFKAIVMVLVMVFALAAPMQTVSAATSSVIVTLPSFSVTLNGTAINNNARQYPLIVYKDITYVPMTWYDSRFLGLESNWDAATGLTIKKTGIAGGYNEDQGNTANGSYMAHVPTFAITVNDKAINNSQEQYPLLTFREITYFPLTWRFAVDEFGWNYTFTPENGLVINSSTAGSTSGTTDTSGTGSTSGGTTGTVTTDSMTVSLPIAKRGDYSGAYAAAGGYFYYEGANGKIYQSPISSPASAKEIYQLPKNTIFDDYVYAGMKTIDDVAYLTYHIGGATMGSDYMFRMNADGTCTEMDSDESTHGNVSVRVHVFGQPSIGNLDVKVPGATAFKQVGNKNFSYVKSNGVKDVFISGEDIYVLANTDYANGGAWPGNTYLYRVNMHNDQTIRVYSQPISDFQVRNNVIYFIGSDKMLYQMDLSGLNLKKVLSEKISEFALSDNDIYYIVDSTNTKDAGKIKRTSDGKEINPGGSGEDLQSRDGYVYCHYDTYSSTNVYGEVILDKSGNVIYQSGDPLDRVLVYQNKLIYVK